MSKEEERKGYCTTKGKISDREIQRQSYKSDVVIAIENRETIGDELLVRSFVSTFTINCTCKCETVIKREMRPSCTFEDKNVHIF